MANDSASDSFLWISFEKKKLHFLLKILKCFGQKLRHDATSAQFHEILLGSCVFPVCS